MMRNLQFSSRATDLRVLSLLVPPLIVVVGGFVLPLPGPAELPNLIGPCISVFIGIFVWGLIKVVRPARLRFRRIPAEPLVMFVGWLALVLIVAFWFRHLDKSKEIQRMYELETRPIALRP
jgi:hypothetical protein